MNTKNQGTIGYFSVVAICRSACGRQDVLPFAVKATDAEQAGEIVRQSPRVGCYTGDPILSAHAVSFAEYCQLRKSLYADIPV